MFREGVVAKLSSIFMFLVVLKSHPGVYAGEMPEEKWRCKVVRLAKLLFADTLQLFTDLSDNIFVVVICRINCTVE